MLDRIGLSQRKWTHIHVWVISCLYLCKISLNIPTNSWLRSGLQRRLRLHNSDISRLVGRPRQVLLTLPIQTFAFSQPQSLNNVFYHTLFVFMYIHSGPVSSFCLRTVATDVIVCSVFPVACHLLLFFLSTRRWKFADVVSSPVHQYISRRWRSPARLPRPSKRLY